MTPRQVLRSTILRLALALLLVVLGGCGSKTAGDTPTSPRPSSPAKLTILEPAAGALVSGPTVHVKLSLEGARIIPQSTRKLSPKEGHVHLSLDGSLVSMAYGLEQDVEVKPGDHILQAEFVAGDHAPFNPRIITVKSIKAE